MYTYMENRKLKWKIIFSTSFYYNLLFIFHFTISHCSCQLFHPLKPGHQKRPNTHFQFSQSIRQKTLCAIYLLPLYSLQKRFSGNNARNTRNGNGVDGEQRRWCWNGLMAETSVILIFSITEIILWIHHTFAAHLHNINIIIISSHFSEQKLRC